MATIKTIHGPVKTLEGDYKDGDIVNIPGTPPLRKMCEDDLMLTCHVRHQYEIFNGVAYYLGCKYHWTNPITGAPIF